MTPQSPSWKKRQEIPSPDIKDAADQFDAARRLLEQKPPGSGVLLPLLNASALALELYLKALASRQVRRPAGGAPNVEVVYAKAEESSHKLPDLFDAIPDDVRRTLLADYQSRSFKHLKNSLQAALAEYEGLFEASRYSYEEKQDITRYPLMPLRELVDFIASFVGNLPPVEQIHWS